MISEVFNRPVGSPFPSGDKWVPLYTARLSSAPHSRHDKHYDGNNKKDEKQSGVKTGAEDVTHEFAPGEADHHA
jgi:hypothetical protein